MKFIVVMFDGLRPDHITAERMPNLAAFAAAGVWFQSSHTVFPSETRVAVSSLVTGSWPQSHGIIANDFFDPAPGAARRIDTGRREDLLALAAAHNGILLQRPSLSQRLARAGLRHAVVSTASPGASFLLDYQAERLGQFAWSVHGHGNAPESLAREIEERFGPVPAAAVPNAPRIRHAARILAVITLIVAATGAWQPPAAISSRTYVFLILSGLATGGSWLCYYRALKLGPASLVAPIDKMSVVLVAVFAILFLGERLTLLHGLGIALIASGAILVAL